MLRPLTPPPFLHEVLGKQTTPLEVALILSTGLLLPLLIVFVHPETFEGLPFWKSLLAGLLMLDIAAGCVANFSRGTSNHYALRPAQRKVFIAIHVHLLALVLLLEASFPFALMVWIYTLLGVLLVNRLIGHPLQVFVAGVWTVWGISGMLLADGVEPALMLMGMLFLFKVVFSFGVDHHHAFRKET